MELILERYACGSAGENSPNSYLSSNPKRKLICIKAELYQVGFAGAGNTSFLTGRFAMVKRKTVTSLDEWLKEGEAVSASTQLRTEPTTEPDSTQTLPTAEEVLPVVVTEPSAVAPSKVAPTENDMANWFWELLANSRYELW